VLAREPRLKKLVLTGIFDLALVRLRCNVQAKYYKTAESDQYNFISLGNLGAQGTVTKSKFSPTTYEPADLPESSYAPANLKLSDIELGMIKYFNPIRHATLEALYDDVIKEFTLPVTSSQLGERVLKEFTSYFPGLKIYMNNVLPFEKVLELMTHSISGKLRKKTSAGLGFTKDRKEIARQYRDDVLSCYELDTFDFQTYFKLFLKDELRETAKATRSIAVGQLHMWVIGAKYLGALYEYFSDTCPSWTGYAMDDKPSTWDMRFGEFDPAAETYGFDLKKQDSRMQPGYVDFALYFLKTVSPEAHWGAIEWYFDQVFYNKRMVDARGNVIWFSQGEPSGHFLTLLMNTLHNLFTHVLHDVILQIKRLYDPKREIFTLLGDDTAMQSLFPDMYRKVCSIMGHDTTSEKGSLFNGVSFLSMKLTLYKGQVAPYYCNMDKMFASLRYTTDGNDEYFQKLCSFYNMLVYAPAGTLEHEWKKRIEAHIYYFIQMELISLPLLACFTPSHMQKRDRTGMVYHSFTQGSVGGLNISIDMVTPPIQRKNKQRKPKKANKALVNDKVHAPNTPHFAVAKIPHRKRKKVANSAIQRYGGSLTPPQKKALREYCMQLLWPTRPIKLVRPIPVRSFAYFKNGEITFESAAKYTQVMFRPHPFRFVELKTEATTSTAQAGQAYVVDWTQLLENNQEQFTLLQNTAHWLCFPYSLNTTNSSTIPVNKEFAPSQTTVIGYWGDEVQSGLYTGWNGVTCNGTIQIFFQNKTQTTLSVALDVRVINADGSIADAKLGTPVSIPSGDTIPVTSVSLSTALCSPEQLFCPMVKVTAAAGNVFLKDITFSLSSATSPILATGVPTVKNYTFGEALYPGDADLAGKVNDAFKDSLLWAPVAMACLYNVTQELSEAGGKFATSYLPSNVQSRIPQNFADAWQTLATYAASYPHAETAFSVGAHATWMGARIDDYSFKVPVVTDDQIHAELMSLPSDIFISSRASNDPNSKFQYYLSFAVSFEIQTLDPSFTMTLGPSSTMLTPLFLAMAAASNDLVGENPSHMKRLSELAKKIAGNEAVQQAFKAALGIGMGALLAG